MGVDGTVPSGEELRSSDGGGPSGEELLSVLLDMLVIQLVEGGVWQGGDVDLAADIAGKQWLTRMAPPTWS